MLKTGITLLIGIAMLMLGGCDSRQPDEPAKINTLKIIDIQPPVSVPLKPGQKVDIEVKLAYVLASKAATVTLAVLRSEGFGSKSLTSTFAIVQQGKGELVLKEMFYVPKKVSVLQVRVPLIPQQRNDTSPTEIRTYKVVP